MKKILVLSMVLFVNFVTCVGMDPAGRDRYLKRMRGIDAIFAKMDSEFGDEGLRILASVRGRSERDRASDYFNARAKAYADDEEGPLDEELLEAAYKGNLDVVDGLIKKGVNVNFMPSQDDPIFDEYGSASGLHLAASQGHLEIVKLLVENGAEIDLEDAEKRTPLRFAAQHNRVGVVKYLVRKGADVNKKCSFMYERATLYKSGRILENQRTPLHVAVENGHVDCVKAILESDNLVIDTKDRSDDTALGIALRKSFVQIARILFEAGARKENV